MNNYYLTDEQITFRLYSICDDIYYYARNYLVSYQTQDIKIIIDLISAIKFKDLNQIQQIYNNYSYFLYSKLTEPEVHYIRDLFDLKAFL